MKKLKRVIVSFALALIPVFMPAEVFDVKKITAGLFPPDLSAIKQGALTARINGAPVKIEAFDTGKSADEVMSFYADEAEMKGYELINGSGIREFGIFLANMGIDEDPEKWYYLFYRQANGDMAMITAAEHGNKTRIVTLKTANMDKASPENGFDDQIRHCRGFEKFISIEIMSGRKVTGFCNFYRSQASDRTVIRSYYEDHLKKQKWNIQKAYSDGEADMFMMEKKGNSRILAIYPSEDDVWIMVTGK